MNATINKLQDRSSYEFFQSRAGDSPQWTVNIESQGAVFSSPGRCCRSSISYNADFKRYLWCQMKLGEDTRFAGGFAVYDAPESWGPWTTAFKTEQWDVGPGEISCLPTKWMSGDGRTIHLVFSGEDSFSVRQGTITIFTP